MMGANDYLKICNEVKRSLRARRLLDAATVLSMAPVGH
jgi:hypothetical protein